MPSNTVAFSNFNKLVDVETGEITRINSHLHLTKKTKIEDVTESIYRQIEKDISDKYPLRGKIETIEKELVILNIGKEAGVINGDIFQIFDVTPGKSDAGRIGRIRVVNTSFNPIKAYCEVLLQGKTFEKGLRVEIE